MADAVRLEVEPTSVDITPGGDPVVLQVKLYNATSVVDEFAIDLVGVGQWLLGTTADVRLFPDSEGTAEISLEIPGGIVVPAGHREVGVRVRSKANASVGAVERVGVEVAAVVQNETLVVEPQVVQGGESGELLVTVRNGGNTPLNLTLGGQDAEGATRFAFNPPTLSVPPGGQAWSRVSFRAPRPATGGVQTRQLTIHAEGGHVPLAATASFLQTPALTRNRLFLLRAVVTILGSGLLVAGAFLGWTDAPEVHKGTDLTYVDYVRMAFNTDVALPPSRLDPGVIDFLTSAGLVAMVLGVLALIGLFGGGGVTKFAGGLALLLMAGFVAILLVASEGPVRLATGVWVVLGGSVVTLAAGFIGTRSG